MRGWILRRRRWALIGRVTFFFSPDSSQASAGIGNFIWQWMQEHGIFLHAHHPKFTWLALGVAGISILMFADKLSYVGYVIMKFARGHTWEPDWRKTWVSIGANVLVWGFLVLFLGFTYIHPLLEGDGYLELSTHVPMLAALYLCAGPVQAAAGPSE